MPGQLLADPFRAARKPRRGVTDTFNRIDDATTASNATSRQFWTPSFGATSGASAGAWGITGNQLYQATNGGGTGSKNSVLTVPMGTVVSDITVVIGTQQTGNAVGAGIAFRYASDQNMFYFQLNRNSGGTINYFLEKVVASSTTTLANGSASALTGTLRVVDKGDRITCYVDGTAVASDVADGSSLRGNYNQGIIVFYSSSVGAQTATGWRFTSYSAQPWRPQP